MDQNVDYILSPLAVRERSRKIFELTLKNQGEFLYYPDKWDNVVAFVYQTILEKYPKLEIPFHSRLGHFRAGGIDRLKWPELGLEKLNNKEKVKLLIDLIIPSVLLDAGAGEHWSYFESKTGQRFSRSEGLGIASFYLFLDRKLSSTKQLTTDSEALTQLTEHELNAYFQVNDNNPLVGASGRLQLLQKLGTIIGENKKIFIEGRPSDLIKLFTDGNHVDAAQLLKTVLKYLGPIWPSRLNLKQQPLGDTWSHPGLGNPGSFEALVPFHKLSQWLSYSILDACQMGGYQVLNIDKLTGLPEYRNGGLFVDMGLIQLKDSNFETCGLNPDMPVTIEWRALTVTLLDELASRLQHKLNLTPEQLPLAKVLEGGSWWAGRKIAATKRKDASPPFKINSDGTVF
jgi:hypothetical protein